MSTATRWGLGLLALLSVNDIAGVAFTDGKHPPLAIAAIGAALGVASLVLIVRAWRGQLSQGGLRALLVLRVLSAVSALPAFFVSGVPAAALVDAIAIVVLTALAVVLLARNDVLAVAR
jgi:hypothetical protein